MDAIIYKISFFTIYTHIIHLQPNGFLERETTEKKPRKQQFKHFYILIKQIIQITLLKNKNQINYGNIFIWEFIQILLVLFRNSN